MKNVLLVLMLLLVGRVNALPVPPLGTPITGTFTVCTSQATMLANTTPGGTWSSSNTAIATVGGTSGIVSGVSNGTATISYVVGANFAIQDVTVNSSPSAIVGSDAFCPSSSTTYSCTPSGGTWNSANPSVITIDGTTGVAVNVTTDTTHITYTSPNGCSVSKHVGTTLAPNPNTGSNNVWCVAGTTTLSNPIGGGVWSSGSTGVATVNASTGVVSGVSLGTATITYTLSSPGCYSASTVTVNAMPPANTGTAVVCQGATTTLSNSAPGGTWDAGLPSVATVGSSSGIVSGVSPGAALISYNVGGCTATTLVTVNPLASAGAITGANQVCLGDTIMLGDAITGGVWSSSNTAIATVGTSGIVSGVSTGTVLISYTVTNSCGPVSVTQSVTVNTLPGAGIITGMLPVCVGSNIPLADTISGGAWASAHTSIATVGTTGIVTGVAAGVDTISYTVTNGCGNTTVYAVATVQPTPAAITGDSTLCVSLPITLANDSAGGTWSSSNSNVSIGSATGIATGAHTGTARITYTLSNGCAATKQVTVSTSPKTITGNRNICSGFTVLLTDTTSGGTWSSTDANISVGGTSGVITGITPGTATVSYTISNGCYRLATLTVNISPDVIVGDTSVCRLLTTPLTNSVPGGTWSSSSTVVAVVGSATGVVLGQTVGTVRITYKMPGNCISLHNLTVLAAPAPITVGPLVVCEGSTISLSDATYGGVWISSNTAVAAVVTPSGLVGGISAGTSHLSYALSNGCYKSVTVTVNPIPVAFTGPDNVCTGRTITLATTTTGGTWITGSTTASVGSLSGVVTGVSAGTASITYRITATGCKRATTLTVNQSPTTITGSSTVCESSTSLLSSTPLTGTWMSGATATATIGSVAGLVSGVAAGTVIMTYTLPVGGCYATKTMTVNALPSVISGPSAVCEGSSVTLTSTPGGGTWASSSTANATAGSTTGIIHGVAAGSANITYQISTGCKRVTLMTINALPYPGLIAGIYSVCQGGTIALTPTVSGGTWSTVTGNASVSSAGVVTGVAGGLDTINYNVTGSCGTSSVYHPVTVNPLPSVGTVTGLSDVCVGQTISLTNAVHGGTWSVSAVTTATVSATGELTGIAADTVMVFYTLTNACGSLSDTFAVIVHTVANAGTITGIDSICIGDTVHMADAVVGGTWSSGSDWIASVSIGTGKVLGLFPGTTSIMYIVNNVCSADTAHHTVVVKTQLECETAVHPVPEITSLQLYPNPTNGTVMIDALAAGTFSVYTMDGRFVAQYPVTMTQTKVILPAGLTAGIYLCRFEGNDGSTAMVRLVYEP